MSYQIALTFEDGITRFVKANPNETVASAAYRSKINIPLDCRDGACGTCKAFCVSGEYDGGDYIEDALTDEEAEEGYCLPCVMIAESDLVLEIKSTSEVAKTAAASYEATVTKIDRHSPTMVSFDVEIANRDDLAFLPGQYVNILVPGSDQTRSYSFSSGPNNDRLSFFIKIVDGGLMSTYLKDKAAVGDKLTITGPFGSFFLRDLQRQALLLAGGSGLAPLLSMLEKIQDSGAAHPIHLIYGVNTDEDLAHLSDLEEFTKKLPSFTWDYVVADEGSSAKNKGYVTSLMEAASLNEGNLDVYLCGPPPMVEAVRDHFKSISVNPASFYFEKFTSAVGAAVKAATEVLTSDAPPEAAAAQQAAAKQSAALEAQPYEIGEEHDTSKDSNAIYEARMALELGAVALTTGRLSDAQIDAYRILAEETGKYTDGDKIVSAEGFIKANKAFHDFLFEATGNPHLLEAYNHLHFAEDMTEFLSDGGYISPNIVKEHFDIVNAIEQGNLEEAHNIVISHSDFSKEAIARGKSDG